ncbi:MAG: response regulator [Anaerolineales bacterium]
MASVPRILAVDNTHQIGNILRGALVLLDRRYILVEVPNADDALAELSNAQVDLLVTAYSLPNTTGLDLAARAIRVSAGTPVIVLAAPNDPSVDSDQLASASFTFLVRPVGDEFLRALRVGLDGEAAVTAQEGDTRREGGLNIGSVPEVDERTLREHLVPMMRETSALGAFVADRMGRVVLTEGITGYFDVGLCAATLAPSFTHTIELRDLLGGNAASLQYYDGSNYDVFAIALGLHYFAVLIFDGTKRPQFGPVTNYGRKEAEGLIEKLGEEKAWGYRRQVSVITQSMPVLGDEMPVEDTSAQTEPKPDEQDTQPTIPEERTAALQLDPLDELDPDKLFSQDIDESEFDSLFSEDDLKQDEIFRGGDNVSFDEAMNLGILDE